MLAIATYRQNRSPHHHNAADCDALAAQNAASGHILRIHKAHVCRASRPSPPNFTICHTIHHFVYHPKQSIYSHTRDMAYGKKPANLRTVKGAYRKTTLAKSSTVG